MSEKEIVRSGSAELQEGPPIEHPLSSIYRLMRFSLICICVGLAAWLFKSVLMIVFAAVLVAVILHGLADGLRRLMRLPLWATLSMVVLAIVALTIGFCLLAGPGLVEQAVKLKLALGVQLQDLHQRLSSSSWGRAVLDRLPELDQFGLGSNSHGQAQPHGGGSHPGAPSGDHANPPPADASQHASGQPAAGAGQGAPNGKSDSAGGGFSLPSGLAGSVAGIFSSIFGFFGTLVVVVMAALYFAASPSTYGNGLLRLITPEHRAKAKLILQTMSRALWSWSLGQALDMVVVGVLSGLGLWALGVPLALVLGVVAGLMNFVPYIGAITGAIPAVLIALSVSSTVGIETLVLYALIQFFEGNVLAPVIQRHAVDMPPGLTILSQTVFGAILGIPGLIFATPITAALMTATDAATAKLDDTDRMGEHESNSGSQSKAA